MKRVGRRSHADDEDFERFVTAERSHVIALGLALTGDLGVAQDVAQETFERAYRHWSTVGAYDRPGAWARRVALNLLANRARSRRRESAALGRLVVPSPIEIADPASERFWSAVRALPERQRTAVALHYLEDMSVDDVATVMECAPGTVKASLHAARQSLAARLGTEEGT